LKSWCRGNNAWREKESPYAKWLSPSHTTEPEQLVERYRSLIAQLEIATHDAYKDEKKQAAKRLRERWKEWQGEDSLHEMAFGEP
jgi:hypothetical protein